MSRRGSDRGLELIIVFKVVKAIVLVAIGVCALVFTKSRIYTAGAQLVSWLGLDAGRATLRQLLHISETRIRLLGVGSILYAAVFAAEAWFLHRRKSWAEWFTVIVTASFLPFEIYELCRHPTIGKVATLVVNVVVVIYLVIRRIRDR